MSRGIERKIFGNVKDRVDFIDRLAGVVEKSGCRHLGRDAKMNIVIKIVL